MEGGGRWWALILALAVADACCGYLPVLCIHPSEAGYEEQSRSSRSSIAYCTFSTRTSLERTVITSYGLVWVQPYSVFY